MPAHSSQILRSDALHNRRRLLHAARELFVTRGLDVPMAAIARRAGVGTATLYRRFPTRYALVTEVFADQFEECTSVIDDALADPDPWHGFAMVIEKVCAMQAADRGFAAAFLTAFPDAVDLGQKRSRAERGFAELTRRAKEAGRLRADFHHSDLTLLLLANHGVASASTEVAPAAFRRLVAYLLQSFQSARTEPLPPPPPLGLHHMHSSLADT